MRKLTLTILMLVSMLFTTAQASDKKDIGFTDGAIIFATGYALQVGALTSVHFNEDLAPLAYIGFMGAGVAMDLVGDGLGHNGHMGWTVAGTLVGSIGAATLGWVVGESMSNGDSEGGTSEYLATAAILSLGPLLGTLSYNWSNRPQGGVTASLVPMVFESSQRERVQGFGVSGTF